MADQAIRPERKQKNVYIVIRMDCLLYVTTLSLVVPFVE